MVAKLNDEEIASRIVQIYFKEIARLGYKRTLSLDEVINAYYYALSRLKGKEEALERVEERVERVEKEIKTETKEELIPSVSESETVSETTKTESTTSTQA